MPIEKVPSSWFRRVAQSIFQKADRYAGDPAEDAQQRAASSSAAVRSVHEFLRAQRLIAEGLSKQAQQVLLLSLGEDPSHPDSLELLIDLLIRRDQIPEVPRIVSLIASMGDIPKHRQADILDFVFPYGSEDDLDTVQTLLTSESAASVFRLAREIRNGKQGDIDVSSVSRAESVTWLRATLMTQNYRPAVKLISRMDQDELPIDSVRRALRRLHNARDVSDEFDQLLRTFLAIKPSDRWAEGLQHAVAIRRSKALEAERRAAFGTAGFPIYRRSNSRISAPVDRRILYVLHNSLPFDSGGYAMRTKGITDALRAHDWDPVCVTRPGYHPTGEQGQSANFVAEQIYVRLPGIVGLEPQSSLFGYIEDYTQKLFDVALEYKPQLLHAASNHWTGLAALQVSKALRIPFVYEVRGLWELTAASVNPEYESTDGYKQSKRLETVVAREADRVVTLTAAMRDLLVARGVQKEKISIVPNGVDLSRFDYRPRRDLRSAGLAFGYVGSLVEYEGLETLIQASKILVDQNIPHRVLIVGDGVELARLEELAENLGVEGSVKFVGRVAPAEAAKYYNEIDVAVFPRTDQPVCHIVSPLKPFEAFASGAAVIASDVEALSEIVEHEITGLLHLADSAESLATQMMRLATDDGLRAKLAIAAHLRVERESQWPVLVSRLIDVYSGAIRERMR